MAHLSTCISILVLVNLHTCLYTFRTFIFVLRLFDILLKCVYSFFLAIASQSHCTKDFLSRVVLDSTFSNSWYISYFIDLIKNSINNITECIKLNIQYKTFIAEIFICSGRFFLSFNSMPIQYLHLRTLKNYDKKLCVLNYSFPFSIR